MLGIAPAIPLIDITHDISAFDIAGAAYTLSQTWHCFPKGTVHLVIVDPGVGSARRPILASIDGHYFVAPDNGVLGLVLEPAKSARVWEITASEYFRNPVSNTFHGRDIFAPVAAYLALGTSPDKFGQLIDDTFQPRTVKPVRTSRRVWAGEITTVDRFGNLITNFPSSEFLLIDQKFTLQVGFQMLDRLFSSYSDAQSENPFVVHGSSGFLEVSVKEGDASLAIGVRVGSPLELKQ